MPTSLLVVLLALSQAGAPSSPTPPATTDRPAAQACAPGSISGVVKDSTGTPVSGAVVSVTNLDARSRVVVGTGHRREPSTGADIGRYCTGPLAPGRYAMTVERSGFLPQAEGEIDLPKSPTASRVLDFVIYPDVVPARGTELLVVIAGVLLYLASVWLARWYNVAWPARGPLHARLTSLKERVAHEPDQRLRLEIEELLSTVTEELRAQVKGWKFVDFLFWSRGQEQRAWMQIHDVEQRLVELLPDDPVEGLVARLRVVEGELRAIGTPEALALAGSAHSTLAAPSVNPRQLRAEISQGLQLTYDTHDGNYWNLAAWQNKSAWLLVASSVMVVAVAAVGGRVSLLVAGATGGLLSRLLRAQRAQETPNDYGASWPTLFFSPLLGALTGWFGVLFMVALNSLNLLGPVFQGIAWERPMAPMALAAACLFGISERLFDGLVAAVEQRAEVRKKEAVPGAKDGDKPAKEPQAAVEQGEAIHIDELYPSNVTAGQEATAHGIVITRHNTKPLTVDAVKRLILVAEGKQGIEAKARAGKPGEISFTTPDAMSDGVYHLKVTSMNGGEWEQDTPNLTVKAKGPVAKT
jgi:hypothetical protein